MVSQSMTLANTRNQLMGTTAKGWRFKQIRGEEIPTMPENQRLLVGNSTVNKSPTPHPILVRSWFSNDYTGDCTNVASVDIYHS